LPANNAIQGDAIQGDAIQGTFGQFGRVPFKGTLCLAPGGWQKETARGAWITNEEGMTEPPNVDRTAKM